MYLFILAGMIYGCPGEEWYAYKGSCFLVNISDVNWAQARTLCQARNAELASIVNENEQNWLYAVLPCTVISMVFRFYHFEV